jgi:peptidoglycan hydrolase-like amidase
VEQKDVARTSQVFVNARGKLTLVLRLPLESYLMGVVPGEIGGARRLAARGRPRPGRSPRASYTLF